MIDLTKAQVGDVFETEGGDYMKLEVKDTSNGGYHTLESEVGIYIIYRNDGELKVNIPNDLRLIRKINQPINE